MKLAAFFSYSRSDNHLTNGFLSKLYDKLDCELRLLLGSENVEFFRDEEGIDLGQFWQRRLDEEIERSFALIPVISPNYLQSEAC